MLSGYNGIFIAAINFLTILYWLSESTILNDYDAKMFSDQFTLLPVTETVTNVLHMNALRGGANALLVGAVIPEGGYDTSFALNEHQAQEELPYQRQD